MTNDYPYIFKTERAGAGNRSHGRDQRTEVEADSSHDVEQQNNVGQQNDVGQQRRPDSSPPPESPSRPQSRHSPPRWSPPRPVNKKYIPFINDIIMCGEWTF